MPKTAENFRALCTGMMCYLLHGACQFNSETASVVRAGSRLTLHLPRSAYTGEKGKGTSGKPLHFKGSSFHRVGMPHGLRVISAIRWHTACTAV